MSTKELIIQELEQISEIQLTEILDLIRSYKQKTNQANKNYKPIWEVADEIIENIPEEILNQLPQDGAENHDYYLNQQHR